ncbi:MAG: NTP transferase domain-containing protein, partial [Calditrichaeota bacterium]|nr:NTP transferase domain-containing protein [Calditrichota bacterium]
MVTKTDISPSAAIIPAAGASTRFTGETRKQFRLLAGKPLLVHTLERVWLAEVVSLVVVAVPEGDLAAIRKLLQPLAPTGVELHLVAGGATRQASVAAGLEALPQDIEVVTVHDAVRPLFEPRWIRDTVALCRDFDGAIVAVPASDTLKEVEAVPTTSGGCSGTISRTMPRTSVWRAQTPQTFRADILRQALRHAEEHGLAGTDE